MTQPIKPYQTERLSNGLTRIFSLRSQLQGCYKADGSYAFGDLCAPTLEDLVAKLEEANDQEPCGGN